MTVEPYHGRVRRNGYNTFISMDEANALPAWELFIRSGVAADPARVGLDVRCLLDAYDEQVGAASQVQRQVRALHVAARDGQLGDPIDSDDIADRLLRALTTTPNGGAGR